MRPPEIMRHEFRAMNTDCLIAVPAANGNATEQISAAEGTIRDYESRFSRFLPWSDLMQLNNSPATEVPVTGELALILGRALWYARLTDGVFDPVVLTDLQSIGYDRSFEELPARTEAAPAGLRRFCWTDIEVDGPRRVVLRPSGALLDLGGFAKGAAADEAFARLAPQAAALVDLGGDIRAGGEPEEERGWFIGLDDGEGQIRDVVELNCGAVATSSTAKRRWMNGASPVHHVIDPRTGRPARSGARQCSVLADTAEHAEVGAKVGLILGPGSLSENDGIARELGVRGFAWITEAGKYQATPGWTSACVN